MAAPVGTGPGKTPAGLSHEADSTSSARPARTPELTRKGKRSLGSVAEEADVKACPKHWLRSIAEFAANIPIIPTKVIGIIMTTSLRLVKRPVSHFNQARFPTDSVPNCAYSDRQIGNWPLP